MDRKKAYCGGRAGDAEAPEPELGGPSSTLGTPSVVVADGAVRLAGDDCMASFHSRRSSIHCRNSSALNPVDGLVFTGAVTFCGLTSAGLLV
jgi:hypothetical protein